MWASEITKVVPPRPRAQPPQKGEPAGDVLGSDEVEAEHLPVPLGVHADRDHDGDVDDAAALTDLLHRVQAQIGVRAPIEGAAVERRHIGLELGGHPGHVGLPQLLNSQGLDPTLHPGAY
jgi:hypothetical protein